MRVHVDGNRTFTVPDQLAEDLQPEQFASVGAWADAIAKANSVGGSDGEHCQFSFKADGVVLGRSAKTAKVAKADLLELIDVSSPPEAAPAVEPDADDTDGEGDDDGAVGEVPDGNVDEVLAWVDGDPDRAARALEVEEAKGDDARTTLVEPLTALAQS